MTLEEKDAEDKKKPNKEIYNRKKITFLLPYILPKK
jgi:hypothetical protein